MHTSVHCLHCDYNLRGLPGDPIRCPECGRTTGIRDWHAAAAQRRTARADTLLARNTGCGLVAFFGLIGVAVLGLDVGAGGVMLAIAGWLWLLAFWRVPSLAGGRPGWLALVAQDQAAAFAVVTGVIVFGLTLPMLLVLSALVMAGSVTWSGRSQWLAAATAFATFIAPVVVVAVGIWLVGRVWRIKQRTGAALRRLAEQADDEPPSATATTTP